LAHRSTYRKLDPGLITKTLEALLRRIEERFPGSGLGRVCTDLVTLARDSGLAPRKA